MKGMEKCEDSTLFVTTCLQQEDQHLIDVLSTLSNMDEDHRENMISAFELLASANMPNIETNMILTEVDLTREKLKDQVEDLLRKVV